jgi:hypothetical protein
MSRQRAMLCQRRILWAIKIPGIQVGRACVSSETPHQSGSVDQRFPIIVVIL